MMLAGLVWAALAPLILVALILGIVRLLRGQRQRWPIAIGVVLAPVLALWLRDRAAFSDICEGAGKPVVFRRAHADGIFLNSGTSNSFGMRYLQEEGFTWVEAPSIYRRDAWVRYERDSSGTIASKEVDALTARYEVREDFSQPYKHTSLSVTTVVDRQSGEVLAKAGSAHFDGGTAKWVLGAWGISSCPSAMRSPDNFAAYYHVAKNALR